MQLHASPELISQVGTSWGGDCQGGSCTRDVAVTTPHEPGDSAVTPKTNPEYGGGDDTTTNRVSSVWGKRLADGYHIHAV
jgi:hypothetical protein